MKKAFILLLQPPGLCREFTRSSSVYPPLGLCQLAATVPREQALVLDAEGHLWDDEQTKAEIKKLNPAWVGMTLTSFTIDLINDWAKWLQSEGIKVMVGGPHASLAPGDTLNKCSHVDLVIRGEGEVIFQDLCKALIQDESISLPGICYRNGETQIIHPEILKVSPTDFAQLPFPDFEGLPIQNYWCPDAKFRPMLTFMTTRGCPHRCAFCSSPAVMGKKIRGWTPEKIAKELEFLVHHYGIKEFSFVDDVFTINLKRLIPLCEEIINRKLNISWFCNARADQITPEIANLMAKAGCHQIYLGMESGSQDILDTIQKGTTLEKLKKGALILKDFEIDRSVGFVIGLPGESDITIQKTIEFAQELKPERIQFTRFTPLVGSPLAGFKAEEEGFHVKGLDQVGKWIEMAYNACQGVTWGKESW